MSEPTISQSPVDHRLTLEERLTEWEASNAARSAVDFEDSDFGKDPDHLRRVSLW